MPLLAILARFSKYLRAAPTLIPLDPVGSAAWLGAAGSEKVPKRSLRFRNSATHTNKDNMITNAPLQGHMQSPISKLDIWGIPEILKIQQNQFF